MSVTQKLRWAFFAAIGLPLIIITAIVAVQTRYFSVEKFAEASLREATQIDNNFDMFFSEIAKDVTFLTRHQSVTNAQRGITSYKAEQKSVEMDALSGPDNEKIAYQLFEKFGDTHKGIAYIYMGNDEGGYIQWPQGNVGAGYDPRKRPWYQTGLTNTNEAIRTDAYYWEPDDAVIVSTVKAIKVAGAVTGVQGMDVSLKGLTEIVKKIRIGETGYLMLVENTGKILADAKNTKNMFKPIDEALPELSAQLSQGDQTVFEINIEGDDYFGVVYTSPQLGWKFVSLIKQSEVLASTNQLIFSLIGVCVLLMIGFIAMAIYLSRLFARPIKEVSYGLESIAQGGGDLTRRLQASSKDEQVCWPEVLTPSSR
ncbi:cache domain-containing protein [Veronia nyctiphanis]|uniref:cache domain-containing protein n=1 Tax=Veronia nyctiphanis TaxID=1278244 RepID=UPI00191BEBE0|nr:cache domain-containing protein [Veronia nyctiphanis]